MEKKLLLAGVIGDPISHSKSPTLHRLWLNQNNINGHYIPLKVSKIDLELVLKTLPKMGFSGVNVTVPHKESVLKIANEITQSASQIGSANTLTFLPCGGFKADNTDGYGFLKNLEENEPTWDSSNAKVLIIGAGGASRAVISALLNLGVSKIVITNRTYERANELKEYFDRKIDVIKWNEKEQFLREINTLINTTTLGMLGYTNLDLSLSSINKGTIVLDLVYNPIKTTLLQNAKKQGCKIIDGLGMLLHQATPGFKEWFGVEPKITNEIRKRILTQ
jgi:shikimate dehydrogenase|tara:strand:- start:69 stop:902 length:834 start_codon:yes stop_codon:yes gene_type:complete